MYSEEARTQKLGVSLLERLFDYNKSYQQLIDNRSPLNILLKVSVLSEMGCEDVIISGVSCQPNCSLGSRLV